MRNFVKIMALVLGLSSFSLVQAKELKIGVINGSDIAQKYQGDIEKKISNEFKAQEDELRTLQEQLKQLGERLQRDQAVLSESELSKLKTDFETKQRDYQSKGMAFSEQVNKRRNTEFQKLLDAVNGVIAQIAKQKEYDIILQKAATAYSNDQFDITKDVIAALEKAMPTKK